MVVGALPACVLSFCQPAISIVRIEAKGRSARGSRTKARMRFVSCLEPFFSGVISARYRSRASPSVVRFASVRSTKSSDAIRPSSRSAQRFASA